ncbi:MAG: DUF1329 domain-containing protein [Opitutaceae bacterium]|jgi:hypothetical protein
MNLSTKALTVVVISAFSLASSASAAVSADQAARLGNDLTPLGAVKAGNADGTIPAWDGGIVTPPAGYKSGDFHPDPYASDALRATITAENMAAFESQLTAGHIALLKAYKDYKILVYPSHRSFSNPESVYENTKKCATTAHLVNSGNGFAGAMRAIPFPIPENGLEAIWNHLARYRGVSAIRYISQAAPLRNGSFSLVDFEDEFLFNFYRPDIEEKDLNNIFVYFKQSVVGPARVAGSILVVHETLDQVKETRSAWIYNPGQRRVRRAPNVSYDGPGTNADNMRTTDQFDMLNGAPDRYDWTIVGKKEMIVPYNSYKLHSNQTKVADIIRPLHLNQDLARYELHRVWVVEAKLKPGCSHIYPRRTFYIDEDSWQILSVDQYDARGQLWRVSEAHCVNYYDAKVFWSTLEVHTDLQAGRYLVIGLDNERRMYDFGVKRTPADFSADALRREGIR